MHPCCSISSLTSTSVPNPHVYQYWGTSQAASSLPCRPWQLPRPSRLVCPSVPPRLAATSSTCLSTAIRMHQPDCLDQPWKMTHMASVCSVYHQLVPSTKPVDRPHPASSPSPNTSPGLANGPTPHRGKPPPSTPMSLLLQTFNLPSTGVEMMARPRADDGRLETRRSLQSANPRPQATPHTYLPATMPPPPSSPHPLAALDQPSRQDCQPLQTPNS